MADGLEAAEAVAEAADSADGNKGNRGYPNRNPGHPKPCPTRLRLRTSLPRHRIRQVWIS